MDDFFIKNEKQRQMTNVQHNDIATYNKPDLFSQMDEMLKPKEKPKNDYVSRRPEILKKRKEEEEKKSAPKKSASSFIKDEPKERKGLLGFLDRFVAPISKGATDTFIPGNTERMAMNDPNNPIVKAVQKDRGLETKVLNTVGMIGATAAPYAKGYKAAEMAVGKIPALAKIANPYAKKALVGGLAGGMAEAGISATNELANSDSGNLKDYAIRTGIGVAGGAALDPLFHGVGNLLKNKFGKVKGAELEKEILALPAPKQKEKLNEILALPEPQLRLESPKQNPLEVIKKFNKKPSGIENPIPAMPDKLRQLVNQERLQNQGLNFGFNTKNTPKSRPLGPLEIKADNRPQEYWQKRYEDFVDHVNSSYDTNRLSQEALDDLWGQFANYDEPFKLEQVVDLAYPKGFESPSIPKPEIKPEPTLKDELKADPKINELVKGLFPPRKPISRLATVDESFNEIERLAGPKPEIVEPKPLAFKKEVLKINKPLEMKSPKTNSFEAITPKGNIEPSLIKVANAEAKPVPKDYNSVQHIDNLINREVKPSPKKTIKQRMKDFADRTYYNMFDDVYGLARLDKVKGKNVRDSDSAIATAHRSRGANAKAQQELEHGYYDNNGKKVGNSFTDILQKSKDPDKLETYLVAKGILDYDARGMVALKTDGLNQLELSNSATKQMELENPNIVQEAEEFYKYLKNQRNILKEGGIFNDAQIRQMEENNPNYVPMERVMDEGIENFIPGKEGLRKRFANVGNPVKKRTGSERQIISPFETTVKRQYVYNNMAERNKAGMAVLNHLRDMPEDNMFGNIVEMEENAALKVMKDADDIANKTDNEIPERINELFRAKEGDNNIIYVYENGNKYKIQVKDKMLFDSMMALDSKSLPAWMNAVNLPVRMLRAGITLSPDFALRNFLRDQLTTGITSQKGYFPFYDAVLGAAEIIKGRKGKSELINAYTRNGGNLGVLQNIDRANTIKTIRELKGNVPIMEKLKKLAKDPALLLEPLRKIGEFSEMSTRIGHMKRTVKNGETMEQAAYNARSTMDFNRAGAWGRQINQMTAFFNASLQGLDVLARSFKDQPIKTARNIGMYVVAPTVALYHLNKDQQWFKDLPEEERDKNWFINAGPEIIKIPKPFEAGILFGASVERGLDKYYQNEGGEYEGYIEELAKAFVPELIPTAVKPLLEVYTNQNFFTGNAIDSMGDQMLPAKDRFNAYNSQFAIKTADILSKVKPNTEISPKDIDQLVRGYTGTLGTSVNEGIDAILGLTNPNIPKRPSRGLQTVPFIRSLVVRNLEGNNKQTNEFYEKFEQLRSMKKTQGDEFQYKDEKAMVEKTYKAISDLQRAKKDVLSSTSMDGKEKALKIKEFNEQITEMARRINSNSHVQRVK